MICTSPDRRKAAGENSIARNAHRMRVERAAANGGGRSLRARERVRGALCGLTRDFRGRPRPASNQGTERTERTQGTYPLASFRPSFFSAAKGAKGAKGEQERRGRITGARGGLGREKGEWRARRRWGAGRGRVGRGGRAKGGSDGGRVSPKRTRIARGFRAPSQNANHRIYISPVVEG